MSRFIMYRQAVELIASLGVAAAMHPPRHQATHPSHFISLIRCVQVLRKRVYRGRYERGSSSAVINVTIVALAG